MITTIHILLTVATIVVLLIIGIASSRRVKDAHSFTTGGKASGWLVGGIIMGTLVGGQSTVGTAQMAFVYGLSAWWFTIGTAVGTLLLGLFFVTPLRRSGCLTLNEIVAREYGIIAERVSSVLSTLGIFISIVAQILASAALMKALFGMDSTWAALLSALFIVVFVFFGGIHSAGIGGVVKLVLLYVCSMVAGIVVWKIEGGISGLSTALQSFFNNHPTLAQHYSIANDSDLHSRYGNLLARGAVKDLGAGVSLLLGVLCTQTYAQAIWAARSNRSARHGTLLCAALTPLIGAACTLVGLYMRAHYITTDELTLLTTTASGTLADTSMAFPSFILNHLSPWLGGIVMGTLFVTILGGGSGLTLGATTIVVRNLFSRNRDSLWRYRSIVVVLVLAATTTALLVHETFINELGFLSLGLRATALIFPLLCALSFPQHFRPCYATLSMVAGTVTMLVAHLLSMPLDPSIWGIGTGFIVMLLGWRRKATPTY